MKDKLFIFITGLLIVAALYAVSWVIFAGISYLVCLCFHIAFDVAVVTGIWLVLCLLKSWFSSGKKD